jgi:catechol 2,3-dioxygenase-like lactoylglutathione lyase family enzyme
MIDHVGIEVGDYERSKAFYSVALQPLGYELVTAGLAAGGKDNGAPGLRPHYHENYYGAYVHDPDGNNVEAVCHRPE